MIDVNTPVTNPELVSIMNQLAAEHSSEKELLFIEALNKAHFLAPMIFDGSIEDGVVKQNSTMSFKLLTNAANDSFFMAFTDWEELRKWSAEEEQTLILTYNDLKSMLQSSSNMKGFVINPFGHNLVITPEAVAYFDNRVSQVTVEEDTSVSIGDPANYPTEMVKALSDFFKTDKSVASAYVRLMQMANSEKPNLLLVIEKERDTQFYAKVASIAQPFLGPDEYIDMVPLNSDFGITATKNATPFYKRKKWSLF